MWTIVVSSICFVMTSVDSALSEENEPFLTSIKPRISEFKSNVHRILEGARIRNKRQLDDSDPLTYKLKFESSTDGDLPYLSEYNLTFWISVNENQVLIGTTTGDLFLFQVSEDDKTADTVALSTAEGLAIKARAFSHYGEQWFVILHFIDQEYYIQMYQRVGRGLERRQKIDLTGFSDMELVNMKGVHYLVTSSYTSMMGQSLSYQASVTLFRWASTQFDAIASRIIYSGRSVACWVLDGSLYIAVAQETNDDGNFAVGSPVFLYNNKEENRLVLWDALSTVGPTKIQHFEVAGNHYLVTIGMRDAVIYWWSNEQFLLWQTLSGTAQASDVVVLALGDGEVSIVIALEEEALFYTLDSSGFYIITFRMAFKGSSLRSMQFMLRGKAYYALSLFTGERKQIISKLTLAYHYLPSVESLDPLQQCLLDTQNLLNERQKELEAINADLKRIWFKGSNQTIEVKVIVEGNIVSNLESRVKDVIISKYADVPDASLSEVISSLTRMNDVTDDVNLDLKKVVLKSSRQEITGYKYFMDPVYIPSLTMEATENDVTINGVKISSLQNFALRKSGDQVLLNSSVSNIYSEIVATGSLNGISTDDYLLLHGEHTITGSLTFSNVGATNVFIESLNSIPTEDIITTNTPQTIRSMKTFSSFMSPNIDVSGETNEVDLSSISGKIALIDNYNDFKGQLTFLSPIVVDGDMFITGRINNLVDISTLVDKTVKRDIQQDLTGQYTFKGKQTIDDMSVGGLVNKVSLDNLLTLATNQRIYADITFLGPVNVQRDLIVDEINGVDLGEQVLAKKAPHQFVSGRKIFTKDITADFVDMTDLVTLDDVDPSSLIQDIVQHKQGVVNQNSTSLKDVVVLDNLNVLGEINGINIFDFISSVWRKSVEQTITTSVSTTYLNFKNDVDVSTVNGLNLDSDLIHTALEEVIEAPKIFDTTTVFQTMMLTNSTINGIDMKSYKIKVEDIRNEGTVKGKKEISSLTITGGLVATKINEMVAAELLQANVDQDVYGPVEFLNEMTYIEGNIRSGSISFTDLNALNLKDYFRNTVMLSQPYKLLTNKHFKDLKANNMTIPPGSTVSGVALDSLVQRAVTLNDLQLITAPKTFASTINFKKPISAAYVNGLNLHSYLNEVVLTDEVSTVKHKRFLGPVQSSEAFVSGLVNGIKIEEMAENVFLKSKDNVVTEHFVFEGDIDVGSLSTPVINGINMNDLIFLQNDEILGAGWFSSPVLAKGDVFITGLLNGCNLSEVSSTLYTNKSSQVITKNIIVQNIVVEGDLKVTKVINEIPFGDLKNLVTLSENQVISSDVVINVSLLANQLNAEAITGANISYILQDAVRHSIPQEITGQKEFQNINTLLLSGGEVFALKLDGLDLEELQLTTVWKNGNREIAGDKLFSSLNMSVALVNGYINGLKLPEDIIRTDTSEQILHQTYFMSDIYLPTSLQVHGLVDGVNLNELINDRVTLNSEQNIDSMLSFLNDVVMYDELTVDGTVNEVVLDLVAKVKPSFPLQGYKVFVEFHVSGPVTASTVNGINVMELSSNILRYNKDEYINEIQVFEKSVHVKNSLFVEWINSIPFLQLTSAFAAMMSNMWSAVQSLQDLSHGLQEMLNMQMSVTQEQPTKFAYFTLLQEIDIGPTNRILHGYDMRNSEFSHSLIMWTEEKHCIYSEKCCHKEMSHWLRVQKNGVALVDGPAEYGRYYPIPDSSAVNAHEDFFIWTNALNVQSSWCANEDTRLRFVSGTMDVYKKGLDFESSALLSDVKSFRKGLLYAVAGFYFDPKNDEYSSTVVYVYNEKYWSKHQILPSFGVLSLDIMKYSHGYREEILLAIGTGMNTEPSYSTVYKWNSDDKAFDLLQNIPSKYVASTLWIQKGSDLFLALAGVDHWPNKAVDCSDLVSGGQINVYIYKESFEWIQSIPIGGVVSMVSFSVDGDVYLAVASVQQETISIFEWRGYSGFVQIKAISVSARHLGIYYIDDEIYMTAASSTGPSKILKMVRQGTRSTSTTFDLISWEQKDEVPVKEQTKKC